MTNVSDSEVKSIIPNLSNVKPRCLKCCSYAAKLDMMCEHNQSLLDDVCHLEANTKEFSQNEKLYKQKIEAYLSETKTLKLQLADQEDNIVHIYKEIETITEKWENAESEVIKLKSKIQGMITSQITLDHIIATQRPHKSKTGLGYEAVAPPVNHNYSKLPLNPYVAPYEVKSIKVVDPTKLFNTNVCGVVSDVGAGKTVSGDDDEEVKSADSFSFMSCSSVMSNEND